MAEEKLSLAQDNSGKGFTGTQVFAMVVGAMCLTIIATVFAIKVFLFPGPFTPVVLSEKESLQLDKKLAIFEGYGSVQAVGPNEHTKNGSLKPEKYSEEGSLREISFTERELNAIVAKNTDLAEQLAIDLAVDMVSIKLLIPLDQDFPMLGGKTLKIKAGIELAYRQDRPVIKLKGVSVMGVPIPNAWLGGIKNIDLIKEFGVDEGFWKTFADGIESINVVEGFLKIRLRE
ncbi:MAG: arginine N-succinyltransferase [Proteobacteria bacterium]|nr:arginine N-succinyltransferase [Pseudomonadota bacterium]